MVIAAMAEYDHVIFLLSGRYYYVGKHALDSHQLVARVNAPDPARIFIFVIQRQISFELAPRYPDLPSLIGYGIHLFHSAVISKHFVDPAAYSDDGIYKR